MTDRRALLTDREREIIAGTADVSDSYRYQTISRVRSRFDRLEEDLAALEAHGDLAAEFRERVCGDAADSVETAQTEATEPASADTDSTHPGVDDADSIHTAVERVADDWDDTEERLAARKAAARAVLEYAAEYGTVSKAEAKEEVYPEHPVDGQSPRTWYRKTVRPVLNEAADYDNAARAYRLDEEVIQA